MKHQVYFSTLLLATCLTVSLKVMAQHKTVVYGSLGVSNVNISIANTPYGTSTDAMGQYTMTLHDHTKTVNLYYSCIGYQDTLVRLTPKQLQRDSINISFRMRKQNYDLQEVTVTAKQKLYGKRYFFMDFETFDSTICILAACPNKRQFCLIMADEDLRGYDTIPIPAHIKPGHVMRDCMGNCQLIAKDSVYEINLTTEPHKVLAVEKSFFLKTMNDCLFATDEHVYFEEKVMQGYVTSFYRVERETKKSQLLFTSCMTDNYKKYCDEMMFNAKNPGPVPTGAWSRFVKTNWFHPSNSKLLLANDTLYYFDQNLGYIQRYDLGIHKIDSCAIQYPFMTGWKHILYQDLIRNKFYTVVKDRLFEIDMKSRNIAAKTKLTPSLYPKIVIHNGQLLLLQRTHDSSGETKTFIERRKL